MNSGSNPSSKPFRAAAETIKSDPTTAHDPTARGASRVRPLISQTKKALKPRIQSRLAQLTPAQLDELHAWLQEENVTYAIAAERLKERFNIEISIGALCRFNQKHFLQDVIVATEFATLLDVTIDFRGVPLRIQLSAPAGASIQPKGNAT